MRERQTETDRDRERQRETERDRETQRDTERERETETETETETDRVTEREHLPSFSVMIEWNLGKNEDVDCGFVINFV